MLLGSSIDMERMYFRTKALLDEREEQQAQLEEQMDAWFEMNIGILVKLW